MIRSSCESMSGVFRQRGLQPAFDAFRATFDASGFDITIEGDRVAWETVRDILVSMLDRDRDRSRLP